MSQLVLVGAGPGDPDLITVKALNSLRKADVVLYDALSSEALLGHCRSDCEKVFVGKKPGAHAFQQVYINEMIVAYGERYDHIVRLKGGDPFVFGRGHEEMEFARIHGMDVEVIPGISSCVAVPELAEIPLTRRGFAESFWVITGTTKSHDLSTDIQLAAQSNATVVIMMGMNKLSEIVNVFRQYGKSDLPVAVIQNGSTSNEKRAVGLIDNIESEVSRQEISSPAIIVIGEVVNTSRALKSLMQQVDRQRIRRIA